jgi:hypothetical protein
VLAVLAVLAASLVALWECIYLEEGQVPHHYLGIFYYQEEWAEWGEEEWDQFRHQCLGHHHLQTNLRLEPQILQT